MKDVKHFRIGNLLKNGVEITELDFFGINGYYDKGIGGMNYTEYGCLIEDVIPVKLTEEDWIKISLNNEKLEVDKSGFVIFKYGYAYQFLFEDYDYLHSLQNLYFALTGLELTVSS